MDLLLPIVASLQVLDGFRTYIRLSEGFKKGRYEPHYCLKEGGQNFYRRFFGANG